MQKKIILLFFVLLTLLETKAQDLSYTQSYSDRLYLNPALVGTSQCKRLYLSYRNQYPLLSNAYNTFAASYDQKMDLMHGGVGVRMMYDRQGGGAFNTVRLDAIYAFHYQVTKKIAASFGLQGSVVSFGQSTDDLVFPDQDHTELVDPLHTYLDFSAGAAAYANNFFAGFAVHHLSRPSLMQDGSDVSRLDMKYTVHGGMRFVLMRNKRFSNEELSITPNFTFHYQSAHYSMNYGLYAQYGRLLFGSVLKHRHAKVLSEVSAIVGFDMDKWRLGYSYDVSLQRLGFLAGGAHEITMAYFFDCPRGMKKYRGVGTITCPSF